MEINDLLLSLKEAFDPDREPLPDIAICRCGWRGPISECDTNLDYSEGDWECGYRIVHLCPKCEDGGSIDNYDMSDKVLEAWNSWFKGKETS